MTGHGFRGIASTALHEQGFAHHAIELQLAHQKRDAVSAAYDHAKHLKERRVMMHAWADHLDQLRRRCMKTLDTQAATHAIIRATPKGAGA